MFPASSQGGEFSPPTGAAGLHYNKGDSRRMKKRFTAFALAAALCLGLAVPASAAGFSDVPAGHWAFEQINRAVADGIVGGYQDGSFKPSRPVSYGAFSLMLARAFYPGELAAYPNAGTEAGEAIMNRHNILEDTGRASRSSGADLPREGMAQCLYKLILALGAPVPVDTEYLKAMSSISDFYDIDANCRRAVMVCYTLGLLSGQNGGKFGPKNTMNRAQACVVISRLRDYIQSNGGSASVVKIPTDSEPKAPPVTETAANAPAVTELPEFKLLPGENVQQMMNRINKATPAYTAGYLSNGKPINEANIQEILDTVKAGMPEDTRWDTDDFYNYYSPKLEYGGACLSFGCGLSDFIFGEDAPVTKHQNFDQLKVGDMVWMKNTANGYNHVVVITSLTNPVWGPYYYSSCSGNVTGHISWDGYGLFAGFSKPEIAANTYVYSRYTDPSLPRVNIDPSSYYNEANFPEVRCASCGYLMQKAGSPDFDPNGGSSFLHCSCGKYFCYQCKSAGEVHMASCTG